MSDPPTTVVNIHRDQYDVYIGRPGRGLDGPFGNPYAVGKVCLRCSRLHLNAASTLGCFADDFDQRTMKDKSFRERVLALRGKRLGCFCKRRGDEPCHGDVIADWLHMDYAAWKLKWLGIACPHCGSTSTIPCACKGRVVGRPT